MSVWTYVKADQFFPDYCPTIKNYKNKIRGKNGRGNPLHFTETEKAQINVGLDQAIKDHKFKIGQSGN